MERANIHSLTNMNNGIKIATEADLAPALANMGFNYEVEMVPRTNYRNAEDTDHGFMEVYRTDTGHLLGAGVTARYGVVQNAEQLGIVAHMAREEGGPVMLRNPQVYDNGRSISLNVDMGIMTIGNPQVGDVVLKRVTIKNSHDGSGSASIFVAPYRLKCKNGMCAATDITGIKIPHTKSASERIKLFADTVKKIGPAMRKTEVTYQVMATTVVNREQFARVLDTLFPFEGKDKQAQKNAKEIRDIVIANYQSADNGYIERDTAWNLLNSITHYTTHEAATRVHGSTTAEQARAMSQIDGAAAKLAQKGMATIVKTLEIEDDISRMLRKVETSQAAQLALYSEPAPLSIFDIGVGQ
jgi:hypothetical protein